jgi:serine/threonine-protein kinase
MASDQDVVERLNAALTGRYHIESEIGSGGMATVYLAQDLRHDRKVAVKVLNPELAAVVGTERFLAEIRTTANLSHPHILPLHDSGEADGFLFYVMPWVEGESLRERLDRDGQLPVEEAVRIAGHVADALHYAHQQGVIHRDIKPGNILFQAGSPVVADFGIALAVSAAGKGRLTETGLSLGTPYYMSPEQAVGEEIPTAASDVYSLGCVLYEMLTGDPPHTGSSAQAILGKILLADVTRPTKLRRTIPVNVEAAVLRALERLPADRFESAAALGAALVDKSFRHGVAVAASAGPVGWRALAVAAGLLAVLGWGAWAWEALRPSPLPVSRFTVTLPADSGFSPSYGTSLALSPDGTRMVFVGPGEERGIALWVKELDQLQPRRLPGTQDATVPFFSPDGQRVGFIDYVGGGPDPRLAIKVVALDGGPVEVLADRGVFRGGGTWGSDGYIYGKGLFYLIRVPEAGGEVERATTLLEDESAHSWADALPNGRGVVFTVRFYGSYSNRDAKIALLDTQTGTHRYLMPGVLARYAESGHLLVVQEDGTLVAVPFDQNSLALGTPVTIAQNVLVAEHSIFGSADLALSRNGVLLYVAGEAQEALRELVWVGRDGTEEVVDPSWNPGALNTLALSPDERFVAVGIEEDGQPQLWAKQLPDGPQARLTAGPDQAHRPVWSSDGAWITFSFGAGVGRHIRRIRSDGSVLESEAVLRRESNIDLLTYTPGGSGAVFVEDHDLWHLDLDSDSVRPLLSTEAREAGVALSPDGRWIAYVSDAQGRNEVFVRPFPDVSARRWPVSRNGGSEPVWAHNGRELFYRDLSDGWLVAASTQAAWHGYDVDRNDQRFLFIRPLEVAVDYELVLVQNLFTELQERVGEGH